MIAVAGPLPADPDAFAAELKWDGVRAVAHVRDGAVRLVSRNGRDVSESYPDLAVLGELLDRPAVLDGEIVAFDQAGRPDFGTLQARMHVRRPSGRLLAAVPVFYQVFDVLHLAGWSTVRMPYQRRRELLDQLDLDGPRVQVPPYFPGAGASLLDSARQQGLEGVVCKGLDSPYLPGRRSDLWRKTKITAMQEVVIGGWKPGAGTGGVVTTDVAGGNDPGFFAMALLADGRLLAAGSAFTGAGLDFALARYDPNGSLDPTFGSGGKVTTDFAAGDDLALGLVVQASGKLVAGGYGYVGPLRDFVLARYTADGTLDRSFGKRGKVTTDVAGGGGDDGAVALVKQPSGKLVAAGFAAGPNGEDWALARYRP